MHHPNKTNIFGFLFAAATSGMLLAQPVFETKDIKKDKQFDVLQSGKLIGKYMYDYDNSSGSRREDTFKTFLQIYDSTGEVAITKALGGDFNHHRGIYIGWNKITIDGQTFDSWHGHGGAQLHQEFIDVKADRDSGTFTSRLLWEKGKNGEPALEEKRTMTFLPAPKPAYAMLDFESRIKSVGGKPVIFDGDPEHAGLQFRVANELDRTKTLYLYPKEDAHPHQDLDYPWLACSFVLNEKTYSVIYLNHPDNPKGAKYSAYRDYARFGAFFKSSIEADQEMTVKVRFIFLESKLPPAAWIQKQHNIYTGEKESTPDTTERGPS